jgi:hypothetical protein
MVMVAGALHGCSKGNGDPVCSNSVTTGCRFECSMSVEDFCVSGQSCILTWDAVLADSSLCAFDNPDPVVGTTISVEDCGNYHVLAIGGEFGADDSYYDRATGMLVAKIVGGHSDPTFSCGGGPLDGFRPPNCPTAMFALPPLCAADGGTDGP